MVLKFLKNFYKTLGAFQIFLGVCRMFDWFVSFKNALQNIYEVFSNFYDYFRSFWSCKFEKFLISQQKKKTLAISYFKNVGFFTLLWLLSYEMWVLRKFYLSTPLQDLAKIMQRWYLEKYNKLKLFVATWWMLELT